MAIFRAATLSALAGVFIALAAFLPIAAHEAAVAEPSRLLQEERHGGEAVAKPDDVEGGSEGCACAEGRKEVARVAKGKAVEKGEAEGEEEEEFTPVDVNAACMLLGGVTFVMALFQLVNVDDDDVRRYAWRVLSNTISIFMAVLFFQGNNKLLKDLVRFTGGLGIFLDFAHCGLYVGVMLIAISYSAGVFDEERPNFEEEKWIIADALLVNYGEPVDTDRVHAVRHHHVDSTKSIIVDDMHMEVAVTKVPMELQKRARKTKMWGTLLAHMAGFAAMQAGVAMQHVAPFDSSSGMMLVPVVITIGVLLVFFQGNYVVRSKLHAEAARAGRKGKRAALVSDAQIEAENDVLSLAISFLIVQAVRFAITGVMPNEEGMLKFEGDWTEVVSVAFAGLFFIAGSIFFSQVRGILVPEDEEEGGVVERAVDIFMNSCAMAFAWCTFSAARWSWTLKPMFGIDGDTIDASVLLALMLSFSCFFGVYMLDKIDDRFRATSGNNQAVAKMISSLVGAISVLVGVAWERSFDGAVTAIAHLNPDHEASLKFSLGLFVFLFVLRPWQKYILTRSMQLDDLKEQRDHARGKELLRVAKEARMPSELSERSEWTERHSERELVRRTGYECCGPALK